MQFIGSVFLVFSVVLATANAAGLGSLQEEKRPPFAKDDPVQEILPKLNKDIRERISENLANDTVALNAVKDAPIEVLSYRSQVVAGVNYFVRAKVASYFFHINISRGINGELFLGVFKGPVAENTPFIYPL